MSKFRQTVRNFCANLSKCEDVYDVLLPLHFATKIFAVSPHSMKFWPENRSPKIFATSIFGNIYSVFAIIFFTAYYVFAVEERNRISYEETNKITNAIDGYQLYGAVLVMILGVVMNLAKQEVLVKAVRHLSRIDRRCADCRIKIEYRRVRVAIAVYVFGVKLLLFGLEFMNCSMFLRQIFTLSDMCLLMCYLPLLVIAYLESQFVIYILLIYQRFATINRELESLQRSCFAVVKLKLLRQLHGEVCEVARGVGEAFGAQMALLVGNGFVSFTTHAYFSFDGLVKLKLAEAGGDAYNTATTAVWSLLKLGQLLAVTYVCQLAGDEANRVNLFLYKLGTKSDRHLDKHIRLFALQVLHWRLKFTANRLFHLDMKLFYSAMASAAAYLMILLQLDLVNKQVDYETSNT